MSVGGVTAGDSKLQKLIAPPTSTAAAPARGRKPVGGKQSQQQQQQQQRVPWSRARNLPPQQPAAPSRVRAHAKEAGTGEASGAGKPACELTALCDAALLPAWCSAVPPTPPPCD